MGKITLDDHSVYLPEGFLNEEGEWDPLRRDLCFSNVNTTGQLSVELIDEFDALPIYDMYSLREMIREDLPESGGIIEAEREETSSGDDLLYIILKNDTGQGMEYVLMAQLFQKDIVFDIKGVFYEEGLSGVRERYVFEMLYPDGPFNEMPEEWSFDPYDPDNGYGNLMNLSEKAEYDIDFPTHPLSVIRELISRLAADN